MTTLTLAGVIALFIGLINKVIPIVVLLALVAFMWLCVRYVMSPSDEGWQRRSAIIWSLIALFVMFSIWGLIRVLCNTFLPGSC